MTQEQYNRVSEIIKRLEVLNQAKHKITHGLCKLSYVCQATILSTGHSKIEIDSYLSSSLSDILDRHDKMIREEIDNEIEKLKKEIEEL